MVTECDFPAGRLSQPSSSSHSPLLLLLAIACAQLPPVPLSTTGAQAVLVLDTMLCGDDRADLDSEAVDFIKGAGGVSILPSETKTLEKNTRGSFSPILVNSAKAL